MMKRTLSRSFWIASAITMLTFARIPAEEPKPASLLGRWDMTVVALRETYPSWLEVRLSGRKTLVGSYVGQFGSARPIANIQFDSGKMSFSVPPQWEGRKHDVAVEGQLDGDTLRGTITDDDGHKLTWTARRAPLLKREHEPTWGEAIELFNGKDLAGWKPKHDGQKHGWIVKDGLLINDKPAVDLVTEQKFDDFKLHERFPSVLLDY